MEGHTTDKLVLKSIYQLLNINFIFLLINEDTDGQTTGRTTLNDIWHFQKEMIRPKVSFIACNP